MRNSLNLLLLTLFAALFPVLALAEDGSGNNIIDYLGLSGGCGAAPESNCSEDPSNGLFSSIACRVIKVFNAGIVPIYCRIVANPEFISAVNAAMMLYVIFLGISFLFGIVPMKSGQLIVKILKAVLVYAFVLNADLYFTLVYNVVLKTPQDLVRIMLASDTGTGGGSGAQDFFQYVDQGMYKIFTNVVNPDAKGTESSLQRTDLKIFALGLALWQFGGDVPGGLFFAVVVGWIAAYFSIMVRYLLAMLALMFILMLGPIFVPMLLFERVKDLTQDWIRMMLCFIAQILLVVAFVLMVQGFFFDLYKKVEKSLDSTTFKQSQAKSLVASNNNNDAYTLSKTSGSGVNLYPFRGDSFISNIKTGISSEDAEKMANEAGIPRNKIPEFVFDLIVTLVIVMASFMFIKQVPTLAVLLIGNPRFIRIFAGDDFSSLDRAGGRFQADLPGQRSGVTGSEGGFGTQYETGLR